MSFSPGITLTTITAARVAGRSARRVANPIHARQAEVEQDHVGTPRRRLAQGLLPRAHRPHVEVVVAQTGAQRALHLHFIVDDQYATAHRVAAMRARGSVKVKRGPRRSR